jgi:hypothetical protein
VSCVYSSVDAANVRAIHRTASAPSSTARSQVDSAKHVICSRN